MRLASSVNGRPTVGGSPDGGRPQAAVCEESLGASATSLALAANTNVRRPRDVRDRPDDYIASSRYFLGAVAAMYTPSSFLERDLPTLHDFIEAHPLATLVTKDSVTGFQATPLPLILDRSVAPLGVLLGHVARANPHAKLDTAVPVEALVMFNGPDAYITPAWYATKRETGRVVPTWNYVAVHAHCSMRIRDDADFLRAQLEALTRFHESPRPTPWQVTDAPADYVAQQMKAIVGIELRIDRLEGKWKMSQNRPGADIDGVVHGLGASPNPRDRAVGNLVQARRPATS
ncbi:MAG: FMN-binding negative transcriptional regulator [Gemmatimonadaceae bacterium]